MNSSFVPSPAPTVRPSTEAIVGWTLANSAVLLVIGCITGLILCSATAIIVIRLWLFEELWTAPNFFKKEFFKIYEEFENESGQDKYESGHEQSIEPDEIILV